MEAEVKRRGRPKKNAGKEALGKILAEPTGEPEMKEVEPKRVTEAPAVSSKDDEIKWYGEIDRNSKGQRASTYPVYYYDGKIEKLEDEILSLEKNLAGVGGRQDIAETIRFDLKRKRERLDKILDSKPKLTGRQKDNVAKAVDYLAEKIRERQFSESDMKYGKYVPEEAKLMSQGSIPVTAEIAPFVKGFEIPVDKHGKIKRNDAIRMGDIMCKVLGEKFDAESLRPINPTVRGRFGGLGRE